MFFIIFKLSITPEGLPGRETIKVFLCTPAHDELNQELLLFLDPKDLIISPIPGMNFLHNFFKVFSHLEYHSQ